MKRLVQMLAAATALAVCVATSGCSKMAAIETVGTVAAATADAAGAPAPATAADRTVLDEKAALALESAYTLSAKAAALAIRADVITDPATIVRIGEANRKAYAGLLAARAAYAAGNAETWSRAFREALTAIGAVNALL